MEERPHVGVFSPVAGAIELPQSFQEQALNRETGVPNNLKQPIIGPQEQTAKRSIFLKQL